MEILQGDTFLCASDSRTYQVIKIDKNEITVKCLDCISTNPFGIEKKDFIKKIEWGIFKKVSAGEKIQEVKAQKEKMIIDKSKPLPKYTPSQNKSLFD